MDAVRILEKSDRLDWDYDGEAGVLYMSIGKPRKATGVDVGQGVIVLYDEKRREVVGLTIMGIRAQAVAEGLTDSVRARLAAPARFEDTSVHRGKDGSACSDGHAGPNRRQSGTAQTPGASGSTSRPRVTTRPRRQASRATPRTARPPSVSASGRASVR